MLTDFYTAVAERRSFYSISPESEISDEQISDLLKKAVLHTPTAFNSQSGRVVLLIGKHHKKLWDIALAELAKKLPPDRLQPTKDKLATFANGYGTVLFFDDEAVVRGLQEKFPAYSDNFPIWAQQAGGILQYIVWTSLEIEGFGASLQHYNPLIDSAVKKEWQLPDDWKLLAQMPFGVPLKPPGEKTFLPVEERFIIFED